ncbi:MAG: ABC transporter permease [Spirochaetaceae bacterium]|jgi:ABC-2 type transport system permease protein|nr:ABC transporter permease [Spirochaetaceae bacterium]
MQNNLMQNNMKNNIKIFDTPAMALAKKEMYSFGISPAFYGIVIFFLLFTSIWLFNFQNFFARGVAALRPYFASFPLAFVLVIPGVTMKSWAEERKTGSVELLLTMPFSEWDLVLGKFLACSGVLCCMLVLTVPLPLSLLPLGSFDGGVIVCEYIGALLLGAASVAIGLFLSALSKNQAAAFLGSAAILLVIMLANQIPFSQSLPEPLVAAINFVSLSFHFESFSRGILDSRDLLFFILTAALFLFLNTRVLLFRKWS